MPEKKNQERIKKYLVGEQGYLKSDLSNGKVIMLSGKWGSGKTHFWQNEIASDILKKVLKEKREVYSYISLYGKSSIEEIENDIFSQAYSSAIGGENFITKGFATFTKRMKRFGSSKIANGLKDEQKDNIERTALSRLNNGGIICFDDFERKSKNIDLNDLFGFITQLTINFKCKVVIILNDDVFEGEEKAIFTNVKEKTVSKFLKYEPSIEELFNSIFDNDERYKILEEYKRIILKTIEEIEELNARIYFQVLDNLLEWVNNKQKITDDTLRCLILVNINFILNHYVFDLRKTVENNIEKYNPRNPSSSEEIKMKCFVKYPYNQDEDFQKIIGYCKNGQSKEQAILRFESIDNHNISLHTKNLIENGRLYMSAIFNERYKIYNNIDDDVFHKINNFIETGILLDD